MWGAYVLKKMPSRKCQAENAKKCLRRREKNCIFRYFFLDNSFNSPHDGACCEVNVSDSFGCAGKKKNIFSEYAATWNEEGRLQQSAFCGKFPRVEAVGFSKGEYIAATPSFLASYKDFSSKRLAETYNP